MKQKKRLVNETNSFSGIAWVTAGREIENYLPLSAIRSKFEEATTALGQFEDIAEYLERLEPGAGKKFERKKVLFAETMQAALTRESLKTFDLEQRLSEVTAKIRMWNGTST
jgi:hypothetical protein